jgi:hypothetical protein
VIINPNKAEALRPSMFFPARMATDIHDARHVSQWLCLGMNEGALCTSGDRSLVRKKCLIIFGKMFEDQPDVFRFAKCIHKNMRGSAAQKGLEIGEDDHG